MDVFSTFVNGLFYESFDIVFMGNIKSYKKISYFFSFLIKSFSKYFLNKFS